MIAILPKFFAWYFIDMSLSLLKLWKDFLVFNLSYFSIPTLLASLFSHWHRYYSPYSNAFDLWKNLESFVFNMMSRIIGAMLRIILIIIGLILEGLIIIAGAMMLIIWIALPILLVAGVLLGFKLIIL